MGKKIKVKLTPEEISDLIGGLKAEISEFATSMACDWVDSHKVLIRKLDRARDKQTKEKED